MKKILWLILVLMVLGSVSYFYRAPLILKVSQLLHLKGAGESEKVIYYCPMHPTYTSNRPGDCPICNMKLEKREEPSASVSPQMQKRMKEICYVHNCPMVHEGKPCPMLVMAMMGESVICPVCGSHVAEPETITAQKKILYWTDPMMPDFKSDKPGQSPMGMDLVPVYEEAEGLSLGTQVPSPSGYAPLLISPQKMQLIGVRTAPLEKRRLLKTIRTVGRVMVDETRIVHVHPKVEGWVEEIFAKYEGDKVTKGQPLFSFYSPDFVSSQSEYLSAIKMLKDLAKDASPETRTESQSNVASAKKRLQWWDISDEQISELEERGTPSKTLIMVSPIDGIVLKKHVFAGEFMERGGDFFHLADLSTIWVEADIYEVDLPLISVGLEGRIMLTSDPSKKFQGKVVYVAPFLKPETRTTVARLEILNAEYILKPEMYVTAEILVDFGEHLAVPKDAVLDTGERKIVFVSSGNGVFEPREVALGAKWDDFVEVKSGVNEGDNVVTSGNFLIDSESRLKSAMQGMAPSQDAGQTKPTESPEPLKSDAEQGAGYAHRGH